ncbi:hypothetical protein D910_05974 [Dendroctonus ponderosae]|uniref:Uncharacterized protein n=1 Tax=Dendroctonus ponderosae TaxID=77166 RepID=U4U3X1_DENPD|nr:hypothetical protein D910_05974 [Dendroctonus ponderosae]
MFKALVLTLLVLSCKPRHSSAAKSQLIDILKSLKLTEKLFRTDQAKQVASLVSNAFTDYANSRKKSTNPTSQVFTGFLKVVGFEAEKIAAIAINGLIFVAQLLGTSLMSKSSRRTENIGSENPLDWVLENADIAILMTNITSRNLPEFVIEYVKQQSLDEESGCVQLLICKISPFIWGMQEAFDLTKSSLRLGQTAFFRYLPARAEVLKQSEVCDSEYPYCYN